MNGYRYEPSEKVDKNQQDKQIKKESRKNNEKKNACHFMP